MDAQLSLPPLKYLYKKVTKKADSALPHIYNFSVHITETSANSPPTMTCASQESCQGCSCSGDKQTQPVDIEDCISELNKLRKLNQDLEAKLKLATEPPKPKVTRQPGRTLRSSAWFDFHDDPEVTCIYIERFLNYGMTREELMSGKPMIGIAQTGSDLAPCNRYHTELSKRVRDGIRDAGGIPFEFPTHPIQESAKRPTAALDRNLAYLSLVEVLYGYFLDGVVLLTGCDKTTPACLMAAATVVSIVSCSTDDCDPVLTVV